MRNPHSSKYISTLFLVFALFSCKNEEVGKDKLQYFDLSGFINEEAKLLSAKILQVDKTVFLNGKEEKKIITISNWQNELNAFKEADINKKSFLGKYAVDSSSEGGNLLIRYSALEKSFRTREISVQYDAEKKPVKVRATISTDNVLYSSDQQLSYETGEGYWIAGKQVIRFLEPDSFNVNVRFDKVSNFVKPSS